MHYATGFGSDWDSWKVKVVVADGPNKGTWECDWEECYLEDIDAETTLTFSVSVEGGFKLNMNSRSCQTNLLPKG